MDGTDNVRNKRVAIDAMGGDYAPKETVHGAVWAARDFGFEVQLVGRPEDVEAELAGHDTAGLRLSIVPASEVINMDEHAASAVKSKPDSSVVVGMKMLREGKTDAFVTMGHSGAAVAASLVHLGRISGIKRPAIATLFPCMGERYSFVFLDTGATVDCKPEYLYQFALMGSVYAERVRGIPNPRVAIASNGEEEGKGNTLVREAALLLKEGPFNFIGNIEGKDIMFGGTDVLVTDGFMGNVVVKMAEGVGRFIIELLTREIKSRPLAMLGALLAKPAFEAVKKVLDYREYGGSILLGVNGMVVIGHGRSDAYAVRNAIRQAHDAVQNKVIEAIREDISRQ